MQFALTTANVLAGIAFDPTIRGILAFAVGVVVLMGSVYLLLATNTGNRLGFLLALTGFFGWMTVMGLAWWIYGIGMKGQAPEWDIIEYNVGSIHDADTEKVRELNIEALPQIDGHPDYDLLAELASEDPEAFIELDEEFEENSNGWVILPASDAARAEAEATVAAGIVDSGLGFDSSSDYKVLTAFEVGGKEGLPRDPDRLDRIRIQVASALTIMHPDHYAVMQIQAVIPQEAVPGEAPPTPEIDPDAPIISVVMQRDTGDLRFPSAMITLGSAAIFGLLCWLLHQREQILGENLNAEAA